MSFATIYKQEVFDEKFTGSTLSMCKIFLSVWKNNHRHIDRCLLLEKSLEYLRTSQIPDGAIRDEMQAVNDIICAVNNIVASCNLQIIGYVNYFLYQVNSFIAH